MRMFFCLQLPLPYTYTVSISLYPLPLPYTYTLSTSIKRDFVFVVRSHWQIMMVKYVVKSQQGTYGIQYTNIPSPPLSVNIEPLEDVSLAGMFGVVFKASPYDIMGCGPLIPHLVPLKKIFFYCCLFSVWSGSDYIIETRRKSCSKHSE